MKKDLIIIGAGGFGREVLEYALNCQRYVPGINWKIKGFIDDDQKKLNELNTLGYEILGDIKHHEISDQNVYIFAIADTEIKKTLTREFLEQGAEFINLVHPLAGITETVEMGVGNIICPYACISVNTKISNFVTINAFATCGHDVVIEDFVTISSHCDITGQAILKEGSFLGSHAVICPKAKVGEYAKVGAGSVVLRQVKPNSVVFGVPAKKLY